MSIRGVQQVNLGAVEYAWMAKKDGSLPKGITGTIAAGGDAGFARALGFTELPEIRADVTFTPIIGDNGIMGSFPQNGNTPVTGNFGVIVFDQVNAAALDSRTIYTEGAWEISQRTDKCTVLSQMGLIVNQRVISQESGTVGEEGWATFFYWSAKGQEVGRAFSGTSAEALPSSYAMAFDEVDTTWYGETIATNYIKTRAFATDPIIADNPITAHTIIGDNSTVAFVLDETPAAEDGNAVQVWVGGTKQTYTTNYAVVASTKTITFVVAPGASVEVMVVYEFVATC